jgi:hypothetical protein
VPDQRFIPALVGFIEGYDLFITGSLLVLAKAPLHLTGTDIQWLLLGSLIASCLASCFSVRSVACALLRLPSIGASTIVTAGATTESNAGCLYLDCGAAIHLSRDYPVLGEVCCHGRPKARRFPRHGESSGTARNNLPVGQTRGTIEREARHVGTT